VGMDPIRVRVTYEPGMPPDPDDPKWVEIRKVGRYFFVVAGLLSGQEEEVGKWSSVDRASKELVKYVATKGLLVEVGKG